MYASSLISTSRSIFRQRPCLINRLCAHSSAGVPQRLGSESELRNPRGLAKGRGVRGTRQRALGGEEKKSGSAVVVDPMPSLVSAEWLQSRVGNDDVKVLDGSWYLPVMERNPVEEFQQGRIPGASFFDVNGIADTTSPYPHMAPSPAEFASAMDVLGITNDTFVIVYDGMGIFSAPRVWWTFKAFGHEKVAVLDGGFPAWKELGCQIDVSAVDESVIKNPASAARSGTKDAKYQASFDSKQVCDLAAMLKLVSDGPNASDQIIDARPSGRFEGTMPEPRPGLRGGHMPGSLNVPFMDLITNGHMKPVEELKDVLQKAGVDFNKSHTSSCGSGMTACIVIFAMHLIGLEQTKLYDASWMEWGATEETPIVKSDTAKE